MGIVLALDESSRYLLELTSRFSEADWLRLTLAISPFLLAGVLLFALLRSHLASIGRIETLEKAARTDLEGPAGPSIHEFCAELTRAMNLRMPKLNSPAVPRGDVVNFVRAIVIHLKARRRKTAELERSIESVRDQFDELRERLASTQADAARVSESSLPFSLTNESTSVDAILSPLNSTQHNPDSVEVFGLGDFGQKTALDSQEDLAALLDEASMASVASAEQLSPLSQESPFDVLATPVNSIEDLFSAEAMNADDVRAVLEKETRSLASLLSEAILEEQRLIDVQLNAEATRKALKAIDDSLGVRIKKGVNHQDGGKAEYAPPPNDSEQPLPPDQSSANAEPRRLVHS